MATVNTVAATAMAARAATMICGLVRVLTIVSNMAD